MFFFLGQNIIQSIFGLKENMFLNSKHTLNSAIFPKGEICARLFYWKMRNFPDDYTTFHALPLTLQTLGMCKKHSISEHHILILGMITWDVKLNPEIIWYPNQMYLLFDKPSIIYLNLCYRKQEVELTYVDYVSGT